MVIQLGAVVVVVVVAEAAMAAATAVVVVVVAVLLAHTFAIYQNGAASLYSLGSMVKKSSSFH